MLLKTCYDVMKIIFFSNIYSLHKTIIYADLLSTSYKFYKSMHIHPKNNNKRHMHWK